MFGLFKKPNHGEICDQVRLTVSEAANRLGVSGTKSENEIKLSGLKITDSALKLLYDGVGFNKKDLSRNRHTIMAGFVCVVTALQAADERNDLKEILFEAGRINFKNAGVTDGNSGLPIREISLVALLIQRSSERGYDPEKLLGIAGLDYAK
jgi:hypothetical protein